MYREERGGWGGEVETKERGLGEGLGEAKEFYP